MAAATWAETIENSSQQQQHSMGFGPFFVHLGEIGTLVDTIMRTPHQNRVPAPWPVTPAKGWLMHRLNDEWSLEAWCALGAEWIFQPPIPDKKRIVHISEAASAERKANISRRLDNPLELIATGEAFAFLRRFIRDSRGVFHNEQLAVSRY